MKRTPASAGQETLATEVRLAAGADVELPADLVAFQRVGGLGADVQQSGRRRLHAEAEFHRLDDGLQPVVGGASRKVRAVQILEEVELTAFGGKRQVVAGDV
jgi:hypothetical protein